jgi:hypothetical protein
MYGINNGWKEGMERIKQEKRRKGKAAAQRRVLCRQGPVH